MAASPSPNLGPPTSHPPPPSSFLAPPPPGGLAPGVPAPPGLAPPPAAATGGDAWPPPAAAAGAGLPRPLPNPQPYPSYTYQPPPPQWLPMPGGMGIGMGVGMGMPPPRVPAVSPLPLPYPPRPSPGVAIAPAVAPAVPSPAPANQIQANPWTAHKTEGGIVYYYNAVTGVSTYEKPPGFKEEPEKVAVQSTPVSMESLAGTDWAVVTTNDGKKYYYNNKTKSSSWQVPNEVVELRKKQEHDLSIEHAVPVPTSEVMTEKGSVPVSLSAPAINTGGRDANPLRTSGVQGASSALDLIKKKLQDSGAPVTSAGSVSLGTAVSESNGLKAVEGAAKGLSSDNGKDKPKDAHVDGNISDSSTDSEDEDDGPTKEECIAKFKEMLKERGVAPFSKWEKELPKIVFDPRFKAIPSHSARRSLFEHYVKTRAEEERKEKRAAQKAAIEGFKQLLEEASEEINENTDYQTFRKKWGNDPRFEALDRKDREHLLNERVLPLKKAAKEKAQAERAAAAASFKSMLLDKGDIAINSTWSRVKDSLRSDSRYRSVKPEDREILFNEYLSELKAAQEEAERDAKAKRDEQEKLKERERELRKRKEREEQEMERVRVKVRRNEAITSFQALLVETIKNPQASWTESKPKLEKDPQGRATNTDLDPSETEKLFREHIKMLHERCSSDFKALLAEVITAEAAAQKTEDGKTVLDSWSTAKRLLKSDARYNKMPRKERETLWRRYVEDMSRKQKAGQDQEDKQTDPKGRNSMDSGRYGSASRRFHDRR
ncbi:Pre-mRNA-processing protein 40C [Turnera subulata]|uniref:Pre-mRNA-processing protein 40C n=1 Tax=Turnera subulata TaxID=218843 RepID=A0A9Q0FZ86_9ROSI|nr:Pre-mRNA-processing protein 40C [Turnera subulata]